MTSQENSTDIRDSPESPEPIQESPESPEESKTEDGLMFIEDRTPGDVTYCVGFNRRSRTRMLVTDNFIEFSSKGEQKEEKLPESNSGKIEDTIDTGENSVPEQEDTEEEVAFVEDRNPLLSGQATQSPRYSISENFLKLQSPTPVKRKSNRFANTCWNCGETSHALRDCPEPKDYVQISRSRKEFQDSKANAPVYKRYHLDESQTFEEQVPGQLSDELRKALGLEPNQLPAHIYMMRRLGYPPGWLEEAIIPHSGIAIIDGKEGAENGENMAEGTMDKFDARKFVQYPGFNVLPSPDTYDDSRFWNCPPMSKTQSLEVMVQRLEGRVVGGYKRKKLSHNATMSSELDETSQSIDSQDMDYEEVAGGKDLPEDNCGFVPPLPEEEELPPPPPTDLPPENGVNRTMEEPSLTELEEQKKQLLAQLNDVSPLCSTPQSRIGKIRSVDLGTPILKSVSPYARLPRPEKFSVNICDVINFENLPDSTGKYELMSGIIRKVRTKLSEMNSDI